MIGGYHTCPDPSMDRARFGKVTGNVVFEISALGNPAYTALAADGIYVDGGGSLEITNNIIYNCDIGMEVREFKKTVKFKSTSVCLWKIVHYSDISFLGDF